MLCAADILRTGCVAGVFFFNDVDLEIVYFIQPDPSCPQNGNYVSLIGLNRWFMKLLLVSLLQLIMSYVCRVTAFFYYI